MRRMLPPEKTKKESRVDLAALIGRLGDRDRGVRERAAGEIFALGRAGAVRCAGAWMRDAELAEWLAVLDARNDEPVAKFPRTTVGVAVRAGAFERIRQANGSPALAEVPADLDAREFELHFAGGVRLDILTTRDESADGAIARFLRKSGERIQQVELDVRNVERVTELLRSRLGLAAIYPVARSGANGTQVNFFLMDDPQGGKLLIELVETPHDRG
jgi:hypothetical protein